MDPIVGWIFDYLHGFSQRWAHDPVTGEKRFDENWPLNFWDPWRPRGWIRITAKGITLGTGEYAGEVLARGD